MTEGGYCTRNAEVIAVDMQGATIEQIAIALEGFHERAASRPVVRAWVGDGSRAALAADPHARRGSSNAT
jgi:hypothetical protein